jgi:hypothetical protein
MSRTKLGVSLWFLLPGPDPVPNVDGPEADSRPTEIGSIMVGFELHFGYLLNCRRRQSVDLGS